jgi:hypothetical protein
MIAESTRRASASPSPVPPGSSAPHSSNGCCAASPTASWSCSCGPASAPPPASACAARSSRTTPSTACAERSRRWRVVRGDGRAPDHHDQRRRQHRRPRVERRRPGDPRVVRHGHPLRGRRRRSTRRSTAAVEINLMGPVRIAQTLQALGHHAAPRRRVARATWPATGAATPPRSSSATGPSTSASTGAGGRRQPSPARATSRPQPPARACWRLPQARGAHGARRRRRPGARRQDRAAARALGEDDELVEAGRCPRRQRRLARRLRVHQGARRAGADRDQGQRAGQRSCGRRSSSPRSPSRSPAGSAASAWPSRSSSATPAACSRSSPACPRAPSTSSPSTSWSRRSSPSPRRARAPAAADHPGGQRLASTR